MGSSLSNLVFHVVFSTKGRQPKITPIIREDLYRYIGGIVKGEGGVLLEIGGMPDHLHLLVKLKPVHAISNIMQRMKGESSKWINQRNSHSGDERFAWQEGYGAFTVSQSQILTVSRYIQTQEKHHRNLSFKDKFIAVLERHGVEYDIKYL